MLYRREKRKAAGESNRRIGRLWVRPWLEQRCDTFCQTLDAESWLGDPGGFRSHLQMTTEVFEELCRLVAPSVKRQDTNMRLSISVAQRVALTLQFLATGETYQSLGCQYRISKSSISGIVPDTSDAIYKALKDDHLKM
ncbi:hypothetical protein NP493_92g05000 [Ridgeia piscesae]|uniref:Nuclease HARBI1 n=1 Tax=Ridgeia piscesae TaxID=27915 RepID=A0AAD9P861_RIDPI|nr:hypothetical protein NP493_92g05000 [Ridgeia piscesae]